VAAISAASTSCRFPLRPLPGKARASQTTVVELTRRAGTIYDARGASSPSRSRSNRWWADPATSAIPRPRARALAAVLHVDAKALARRLDRSGDFLVARKLTPRTPSDPPSRSAGHPLPAESKPTTDAELAAQVLGFVGRQPGPGRPGAGPQPRGGRKSGHRPCCATPPRRHDRPRHGRSDSEAGRDSTSPWTPTSHLVETSWNRRVLQIGQDRSVVFLDPATVRSSHGHLSAVRSQPLRDYAPASCAPGDHGRLRTGLHLQEVTGGGPGGRPFVKPRRLRLRMGGSPSTASAPRPQAHGA